MIRTGRDAVSSTWPPPQSPFRSTPCSSRRWPACRRPWRSPPREARDPLGAAAGHQHPLQPARRPAVRLPQRDARLRRLPINARRTSTTSGPRLQSRSSGCRPLRRLPLGGPALRHLRLLLRRRPARADAFGGGAPLLRAGRQTDRRLPVRRRRAAGDARRGSRAAGTPTPTSRRARRTATRRASAGSWRRSAAGRT